MAVAGLFGWYMHRQGEKKDEALRKAQSDISNLTQRLIDDKEKRILSEQQQISMLKELIDKTGSIPAALREGILRLEQNQKDLKKDIQSLKELR